LPDVKNITIPIMITRHRFLLIALVAFARITAAEDKPKPEELNAAWLAEHYTKYEHRIRMRDGVRLFTRVFVPKDDSTPWPIILTRTPYALKPYGTDNFMDPSGSSFGTLAKDKFIMVAQDVRGRYGSEGTYMHVRPFNPNKGLGHHRLAGEKRA
jgi:predicted acyl esterase